MGLDDSARQVIITLDPKFYATDMFQKYVFTPCLIRII